MTNLISIFEQAMPFIQKSAPAVAAALGGPMAATAVSLLSTVFNSDPKNLGDLIGKIITHPESENNLKRCDQHMSACYSLLPEGIYQILNKPTKFSIDIEWGNSN
jgi:hypothetical protein